MSLNSLSRSGKILAVLCVLCCSSNVFAGEFDTPTPTIDKINAAATDYTTSYTLIPLSGTLQKDAVQVTINGTKYYYTPGEGADVKTLQTLANIGETALIETPNADNTRLTYFVNGKYYTYDTNKLPESGYTLTPVDAPGDTTITLYNTGTDGTLTPVYYNVALKKTSYGSGDTTLTYGWEKNADNRLEFKQNPATHIGQQITYNYNSSKTQKSRIDNTTDRSGDTIEGLFTNQKIEKSSGTAYGGAINNHGTSANFAKLGNINADFINNYAISSSSSTAAGGAIYNDKGVIKNITGDFVGNYAKSSNGNVWGGAILNWYQTIDNITGDFIGNYIISSQKEAKGGALHNDTGKIGNITGDFIGNYATGKSSFGGAIYNTTKATIKNITGDFIGNYIISSNNTARGGVIFNNTGTIGNITGDFIGNYAVGNSTNGGAIYNNNSGSLGNITGDFIGNYAKSSNGEVSGGAIYNTTKATIKNITGNFTDNYIISSGNDGKGGAIFNNTGTIGNITGDFTGNYIDSSNIASGGAIYSYGSSATLGNINANFINNYTSTSSSTSAGGAIYNYSGKIGDITGDFIGNYAKSTKGEVWGGAILNWYSSIKNIEGNFKNNYIVSSQKAKGGAIHNDSGTIEKITGNFTGNYASGSATYGGVIYNTTKGVIGDITGDFIDNYANSSTGFARGGVIYNNNSKIGKLDDNGNLVGGIYGSFINNYAKTTSKSELALGGVAYTNSDMNFIADGKDIEFTGNYTEDSRGKINNAIFVVTSSKSSPTISLKAQNNGTITFDDEIDGGSVSGTTINRTNAYNLNLTGDTTGLIALNDKIINANAVHDNVTLKIGSADTFKDSALTTNSGIIDLKDNKCTNYTIKELNSSENTRYNIDISLSKDEQKSDTFTLTNGGSGVIYLSSINATNFDLYDEKIVLQIIKSKTDSAPELAFDSSKVIQRAIPNMTSDTIIAKDFGLATTNTTNDSIAIEGFRNAFPEWAELQTDESKSFTFVDNSEYILSRDITALNGTNLTINGHNNILNLNNKNIFSDIKDTQEITMNNMTVKNVEISNNGTINLDTITLDNSVNVNNNNTINISGNNTINSKITGTNGNININNGETTINASISNQSVLSDNSTINLNDITGFNNNNLSLVGSNLNIQNLASNNLYLNNLNVSNSNISIGNIDVDLINKSMGKIHANTYREATGKIDVQNVTLLNDAKTDTTDIFFADAPIADIVTYSGNKIAYSPIYKYDISYNKNPEDSLGYFSFIRPGVSSGNVSNNFNPSVLSASVSTQAGAYANMTETLNYSFRHIDKTYMPFPSKIRTSMANRYAISENQFMPYYTNYQAQNDIWVQPYVNFENMHLKNGPRVDVQTYGTLVGGDGEVKHHGNGWDTVGTVFLGYNGSSQSYSGVNTYTNGGVLGVTETFYKNNFFTALTVSAGASVGESNTMFGHEDFTTLMAGIASKTGYNFEFKEGAFIIQPSWMMAYSYIDTFDYRNASGVRITADPTHSISLRPNVKFIGNIGKGWQPYASVGMVWNLMNDTRVTANEVRLPEMSIKPYIEYGVGLQKTWADKFSGFGQAMLRNGGRNGISLTFGFRWALGGERNNHNERVQAPETTVKTSHNRTILKQLPYDYRTVKAANQSTVKNIE